MNSLIKSKYNFQADELCHCVILPFVAEIKIIPVGSISPKTLEKNWVKVILFLNLGKQHLYGSEINILRAAAKTT